MSNYKTYSMWSVTSLLLLSLFSLHFLLLKPIVAYSFVWIFSSSLFLIFSFLLSKENFSRQTIFALVIISIVIRLSFITTAPIGSDDVYRYMWDGKTQHAGLNPYLYKPLDQRLNFLHSDILPSKLNFQEMKTIYFPLSQWLFFIGYSISGENIFGYKLLILLFELTTLLLIYRLIKKIGLDEKYILLYAICPLSIIQFAVDAHLDAFGLPIFLLALYFYLEKKNILSAIMLGLSFSIKPVAIVMLPVFFLNEKRINERLKFLIIPFIAFGLQFIPYIFSSNPFEAFLIYTKNWFYNGMVFNSLNLFLHNNQTSRMVCSVLMVFTLLLLYFSKKDWLENIYYSLILLMIFSPVVHPWYITWVAIFSPLLKKWSAIYFVAASSLTTFTLLNYILNGVWKDYWLVQSVEFIGLIFIMLYELFHSSNKSLGIEKFD